MTPEERRKAGPKNGAVATATINVGPLGDVSVHVSSAPQGQGHQTTVAQVVAEVLGVALESIVVNVELDTQKDAWSIASGNYSSRFAGAVAGAVYKAALKIRDRLAAIAAEQLQASPEDIRFAGGKIFVVNGGAVAPFHRIAGATHWSPGLLPEGESGGLRETAFWSPPQLVAPDDQDQVNSSLCYGFVFDICGLEIDRMTGEIHIDRYVTCHDAGRLLNPALVDGQIRGGFTQGLGAAHARVVKQQGRRHAGIFRPTPRFLRLGAAYLDAAPLPQLAQPYLASAREALGESISLAVFEDGWSVFVARAETAKVVTTGVRLRARLPAYGSATGQVLLAGLSDEEIRRYLTNPPSPTTAHMIVDPKVIMDRIERARIEGFAFTDEELELGMRSMAVPVRNAQGKVVAAMSVSTFTARLTLQELRDQCLPVLQQNAALLGCML